MAVLDRFHPETEPSMGRLQSETRGLPCEEDVATDLPRLSRQTQTHAMPPQTDPRWHHPKAVRTGSPTGRRLGKERRRTSIAVQHTVRIPTRLTHREDEWTELIDRLGYELTTE